MGGSRRLASTVGSLAEQAVSLQMPYRTVASGGNRRGGGVLETYGSIRGVGIDEGLNCGTYTRFRQGGARGELKLWPKGGQGGPGL